MANVKADVEKAQKAYDFNQKTYTVELTTTHGPIRLQFFPDKAPGHVKNFLALAQTGFYNGLIFHRVIDGFMIQGGCPQGTGTGGAGYNLKAEFNDTPHVPGVLSMARSSSPDSASCQFFICTGTHGHLDGSYTAFGKVADAESLATVQKIGKLPTDRGDRPRENVAIESATIHEQPKA